MKDHDANRHPGPWRVMQVDAGLAGIIVAVGFLVMGLVSIPVVRWFLLGALLLGGVVALLLRLTRKEKRQ
jgi:hypothetical protein